MGCISSTRRQRLTEALERILAQLEKLYTTYDQAISGDQESYTFDSGEGRQTTKRRKPAEIKDQIDLLESQADRIYKKLNGTGVVNFNMRRKQFFQNNGSGRVQ